MIVDKEYCMNSFLMYRIVADDNKCFSQKFAHTEDSLLKNKRIPIYDSLELGSYLKEKVSEVTKNGKYGLALSGGIDSAILAKFMPAGSIAYTFKCIANGKDVIDETPIAKQYAADCDLIHKTVEIYWDDVEKNVDLLMKRRGAPIHSIEVQIYKAAMQAKEDGLEGIIFGETADCIYGGFGGPNGLLLDNWKLGQFIDRNTFIMPYKVLKNPMLILEPYKEFEKEGIVDSYGFISKSIVFFAEGYRAYMNAMGAADMKFIAPYSDTYLAETFDYYRVNNGENKYLVREIFKRLYPQFAVPPKIAMPRPMGEWLKDWKGPTRDEFLPHCTDNMTGDQKWMVYILERFLNLIDKD